VHPVWTTSQPTFAMIIFAPKPTFTVLTGLVIVSLTFSACSSQPTSNFAPPQPRPALQQRTAHPQSQASAPGASSFSNPSPNTQATTPPPVDPPPPSNHRGGSVVEFTSTNFDSTINRPGAVVLLDFAADWCGPCRQLAPTIDQVAQNFAGQSRVIIGRVDVDQQPELSDRYGVEILPTLLYLKNGRVQKTSVGPVSAQEISATLTALAR